MIQSSPFVAATLTGIALSLPVVAQDQGWVPMNGPQITAALSNATVTCESATQLFYASGRTLYSAARDSWGRWQVRGDACSSQWPPSDAWPCHRVARKGDMLRFAGSAGDLTDGHLIPAQ